MNEWFDSIQRLYQAMASLQQPVQECLRSLQQALAALRNPLPVSKEVSMVMKALEESQQQMRVFREVTKQIVESAGWVRTAYAPLTIFEKELKTWGVMIRQIFEELPKQTLKVMQYLFEQGWYLGPQIPIDGIRYLAELIDQGDYEEIELAIQRWAEERLEDILAKVKQHFSSRFPIISDAVAAHRKGKYSLSVPVILAQADGIAYESVGTFLFRGNPPKEFQKYLETFGLSGSPSVVDSFLAPLRSYSTLAKKSSKSVPEGKKGHLNRHEVLHGMDTDYATKANSLRAILLVDYLLGIREILDHTKKYRKKFTEAASRAAKPRP